MKHPCLTCQRAYRSMEEAETCERNHDIEAELERARGIDEDRRVQSARDERREP